MLWAHQKLRCFQINLCPKTLCATKCSVPVQEHTFITVAVAATDGQWKCAEAQLAATFIKAQQSKAKPSPKLQQKSLFCRWHIRNKLGFLCATKFRPFLTLNGRMKWASIDLPQLTIIINTWLLCISNNCAVLWALLPCWNWRCSGNQWSAMG